MTQAEWAILERLLTSTSRDHPGRTAVDAIYYLADSIKEASKRFEESLEEIRKEIGVIN